MTIGIWQVVLILAIVLILFGAGKLPRVMGDVAKGIKSFKAGMRDDAAPDVADTADAAKPLPRETAPPGPSAPVQTTVDVGSKQDQPAKS